MTRRLVISLDPETDRTLQELKLRLKLSEAEICRRGILAAGSEHPAVREESAGTAGNFPPTAGNGHPSGDLDGVKEGEMGMRPPLNEFTQAEPDEDFSQEYRRPRRV